MSPTVCFLLPKILWIILLIARLADWKSSCLFWFKSTAFPLKMSLILLTEVIINPEVMHCSCFCLCPPYVLLSQIFCLVFHCSFLSFLSHDSCFPGSKHNITQGLGWSRQRLWCVEVRGEDPLSSVFKLSMCVWSDLTIRTGSMTGLLIIYFLSF